ncbi:MAG: GNAT family N-acetyltransferase [Gammaproteobacteria bacterium]
MTILRRSQGVQYEIFSILALNGMASVVAEAFTRYEPMTVIQNIQAEEFVAFVKCLGCKAQRERLTIIASDVDSRQVIGALIADDLASDSPEGIARISDKFDPILALLGELDAQYTAGANLRLGDYLHLFMIAVTQRYKRKKVAQNLIQLCLENGINKGYKVAVTEATGTISQHIFKNRFGFEDRYEISYKGFVYKGERIFEAIAGHAGVILMDKQLI